MAEDDSPVDLDAVAQEIAYTLLSLFAAQHSTHMGSSKFIVLSQLWSHGLMRMLLLSSTGKINTSLSAH